MTGPGPAGVVVLAGISAALHVGKLPPALPVLREALGVTLLQAGFLLSLVQLAGMLLGLAMGAAADALGGRRTMVLGLVVLGMAGLLGGFATTPEVLLALRAAEGAGLLLAALPAPGLIRRLVEPGRLSATLGLWGAYMPIGTGLALLIGPGVMAAAGWQVWWWVVAACSLVMAAALRFALPADPPARAQPASARAGRIARTLAAGGPWLVAITFATYSAQWLAVIGFLPTIYAQSGLPAAYSAPATALAATANMIGNIASGRLLQRGVPAPVLLWTGFGAMACGAALAFAPWAADGSAAVAAVRYAGVLLFSAVGGLVPGTLFAVGVRLAPDDGTVSTTMGWVQQWSSLGQFGGPPLAALLAAATGGWSATWWLTGALALAGAVLAGVIGRKVEQGRARAAAAAS
ncbi:MAG TPA: MFS transporter [Ramlibacter sp.]|nr:MFS transporter [Ramlibacter sp.]